MVNYDLLRTAIEKRGYNSKIVAHILGVSPVTMSNLLNGRNTPSFFLISALYYVLDLSNEEFLTIFWGQKAAFLERFYSKSFIKLPEIIHHKHPDSANHPQKNKETRTQTPAPQALHSTYSE